MCLYLHSCRHTCLTESCLLQESCRISLHLYSLLIYIYSTKLNKLSDLFTSHHQPNTTHRIREPCLNHGNHIHIVMSIFVRLTIFIAMETIVHAIWLTKTCIMISLVFTFPITNFSIYFMVSLPSFHFFMIIIFLEIFHYV